MTTNYDKPQVLIDQHLDSIDQCIKPLLNEILEEELSLEDEAETKKLFRKISIYIILASGLGNPGVIQVRPVLYLCYIFAMVMSLHFAARIKISASASDTVQSVSRCCMTTE